MALRGGKSADLKPAFFFFSLFCDIDDRKVRNLRRSAFLQLSEPQPYVLNAFDAV